jgi:diacylglycerol kinase family enzyme
MKATLLHNPGAGEGEWSRDRILEALAGAGLDCDYWSFDDDPLDHQERFDPDAPILVAGGDGAVARTLKALSDRSRPIGILPVGGSNNMARSLGVFGPIEEIAAGLVQAQRRSFGLLRADGACGARRIAEAIGVGALNESMEKDDKTRSTEEKREHGRSIAREAIAEARPIEIGAWIDGRPIEAELLFIEALNVPMIGPHLRLVENPHDAGSVFEVVWLEADDAPRFLDWLDGPAGQEPAPLSRRTVERLTLVGAKRARIDDDFVDCDGGEVVVTQDPPALSLLTPFLGARTDG